MSVYNANNERLKRQYFSYLKEAKRFSATSLDPVAKALDRFETYSQRRNFKTFHHKQAIAFKRHLAEQTNSQSGERLSKATLSHTLSALRNFFAWLSEQPGYRSHFSSLDANYFNLSEKETSVARARREPRVPTLNQVLQVLKSLPITTEIERRNRALIAFTILTGARDGAIASLKVKHVDPVSRKVFQDAREVKTKFSKSFTSSFFPVGDDILDIFTDWYEFLTREKGWTPDDPLFPATCVELGPEKQFRVSGLARQHWSGARTIRVIFKQAFLSAGLPYFNPHSFRKTLVSLGMERCRTPEEFKAWSQNLGHEQVLTTFTNYGEVTLERQREIIEGLNQTTDDDALMDAAKKLAEVARRSAADT